MKPSIGSSKMESVDIRGTLRIYFNGAPLPREFDIHIMHSSDFERVSFDVAGCPGLAPSLREVILSAIKQYREQLAALAILEGGGL